MKTLALLTICLVTATLIGCGQQSSDPSNSSRSASAVDGSKYLLAEEPQGAKNVISVRESAEEGEDVLVVGRIGGGANPWIDGRAAFTIVDPSLRACSDIPGDNCPKPWDYCCVTDKLPTSTALVKVVDENGALVEADARELLQVKELSTVVVKGKAQRDDAGNLTVLAHRVYVQE